jgi:hypothetical protein
LRARARSAASWAWAPTSARAMPSRATSPSAASAGRRCERPGQPLHWG